VPMASVVALIAGTAGEAELALDFAQQGRDQALTSSSLPHKAWTAFILSELLFGRNGPGDREKATELQDEAIAIATALGMKPLLERVLSKREILKA